LKSLESLRVEYKAKTENQRHLVDSIRNNEITICSGPPGSGKTLTTCAIALELFKTKQYDKIIIAKSVQTIKDEEIGFLKGTIQEKMEPSIQSFIQNFNKLIGKGFTKMLMDNELIEVMPLAYIRGCTRDNEIVIIDETQNISVENIRTVLTRIGENTKMIFLGDEEQIDLRDKSKTSLKFIKEKLENINGIGIIELGYDDVLRNPIIKKIEEVFRAEKK
jgi:phosphate starvation-inducible PhoH-like protein